MLADPRSENLARNFTGQWLQARDVEGIAMNPREIIIRDAGEEGALRDLRQAWRNQDEATAKRLAEYIDKIVDAKPEFDNDMRKAMRRETEMYFGYLIAEDRPGHRADRQRLHLRQREARDALRPARRHRPGDAQGHASGRQSRAAACSRKAARCWSRPIPTALRP